MVDFALNGSSIRCELADLMIVVDRLSPPPGTRTASLIQAKMARAAERVQLAGRSSLKQLDLYQNWPSFAFADVRSYGTGSYLLGGRTTGVPGWFGVVDRHLKNGPYMPPPAWTQHLPSPTPAVTTGGRTLGAFITDAVFGASAGRQVAVPAATDWDRLVELLLRVTYAEVFTHAATLGPRPAPRGMTALAFKASGVALRLAPTSAPVDGIPPVDGIGDRRFDPHGLGISVLHVTVDADEG